MAEPETWGAAQQRKVAERAALEAERSEIGQRAKMLAGRKAELERQIVDGNRRRQDVSAQRAELAPLEQELADARQQLAGVANDIAAITGGGVDSLPQLLEQHRPELQLRARARSADAAEQLDELTVAFARFQSAYAAARYAWREAWALGRADGGHRADLADSRMPGSSIFDTAAVQLRSVSGVGHAPAGTEWVRPVDLISELLDVLGGNDCLPACVVRGEQQRRVGAYRDVCTGLLHLLDERALERRWQDVTEDENGVAALRFERELTDNDRYVLESNRAERDDWISNPERGVRARSLPSPTIEEITHGTVPAAAPVAEPPAPAGGLVRVDDVNSPPLADGWLDSAGHPDTPLGGWVSERRSV